MRQRCDLRTVPIDLRLCARLASCTDKTQDLKEVGRARKGITTVEDLGLVSSKRFSLVGKLAEAHLQNEDGIETKPDKFHNYHKMTISKI